MRFMIYTLIFCGFLVTTFPTRAAEEPAKVLKHIVMYKFHDTLTAAQVEEVVEAFGKMTKQIDTVIDYEHGTNVSQEMKSEGFTHVFVVTFSNEAGRAAYLKHAAHDTYVALAKERREKVIVLDYWTSK